jgi:malonyl-CoA O-methyltransferase
MGAKTGSLAPTATRKPVMTVQPSQGHQRWAATYCDSPNPMVSLVDRHLRQWLGDVSGLRVIDVACGPRALPSSFGADLSIEMLRRNPARGRVVQADARLLPFASAAADVVVCTLALGYIHPARAAMKEMRRIARRGGIVIASDVHPAALAAGWKRSFRDAGGISVEIESRAHSLDDLEVDGLTFERECDLHFGDPEREIYERAGRLERFDGDRRIPAAWIRQWRR